MEAHEISVSKVRDGGPASPGEFAHQVSLQFTERPAFPHFCGASIIHPLILLTAAHCFKADFKLNTVRAFAGEHNLWVPEGNEQVRNVIQRISHENWTGSLDTVMDNDIALLVLDEPLEFNNFTKPIRIPKTNSLPASKNKLQICI